MQCPPMLRHTIEKQHGCLLGSFQNRLVYSKYQRLIVLSFCFLECEAVFSVVNNIKSKVACSGHVASEPRLKFLSETWLAWPGASYRNGSSWV